MTELCKREGCGHKEDQHATNGRCLACLVCFNFQYWVDLPEVEVPEYKMLTADEFEGLKNEVSFANSRIEELTVKLEKTEQLRRESMTRESVVVRNNFDLLRQNSILDTKLEAALNRITELEEAQTEGVFGPPLLHFEYFAHEGGHDESNNIHRHVDGKYQPLGGEVDGVEPDLRQVIEEDQEEQAATEWERLRTFGEE